MMRRIFFSIAALLISAVCHSANPVFDVRDYGAVPGDGRSDSNAINAAMQAAFEAGGGTVNVPAGVWDCFTLFLKDNVILDLSGGCVIKAAMPDADEGYVQADPDGKYPKWGNSLIYAENLVGGGVTGNGLIDGSGVLTRGFGSEIKYPVPGRVFTVMRGRNLLFRDFSVTMGGGRVLWLVGTDNVTIDNLHIDSNRDGMDIDSCHNVRISNCTVNCLNDDAIVLKSASALGEPRAYENITITNCQVSGYDPGTFLSGKFGRTISEAPDLDGPTGRIKMGTESLGGFRNITISNCVFDRSRGLAIECVDGGIIEDVTVTNVSMREICNSPFFIRLGGRLRGGQPGPSIVRRVNISHLSVKDADCRYASIIAGLPNAMVEDVSISDVHIQYKGGLGMEDARNQLLSNNFFTAEGQNGKGGPNSGQLPTKAKTEDITPREAYDIPECETAYPEPSIFGVLPAYGLFVRHARNVRLNNVVLETVQPDERPAVVLMDVENISFDGFSADRGQSAPLFVLKDVRDLKLNDVEGIKDKKIVNAADKLLK